MRKAIISVNGIQAGMLEEISSSRFKFIYLEHYKDAPVSLTMPVKNQTYEFDYFPAFFEGLLPEGVMLEGLLRKYKLDKNDLFGQLIQVGHDLVGAVTVETSK